MGQRMKGQAQLWPASVGPPEAHLAAHLCATQWLRVRWPQWGGWPLKACSRAAGAMFVTYGLYGEVLSTEAILAQGQN